MSHWGRPPGLLSDAPVGLCGPAQEAGLGAGCRPGGPPHQTASVRFEAIFEGVLGRALLLELFPRIDLGYDRGKYRGQQHSDKQR
jgi:hypothetical protein